MIFGKNFKEVGQEETDRVWASRRRLSPPFNFQEEALKGDDPGNVCTLGEDKERGKVAG